MEKKEEKKFFEDVVEANHKETWQEREEREEKEKLHETYLMTCGKPYC